VYDSKQRSYIEVTVKPRVASELSL